MSVLRQSLSSVFLLILSIFLFNSCFPTQSDEEKGDPEVVDTTGIDPTDTNVSSDDLPKDIDPGFVVSNNSIDSLFNVLVKRVETLQDVETTDDVFSIDFLSIRKGFATAISKQPSHAKANVGFIISAICALNTSNNVKKAVDSIQSYIDDVDNYYYSEEPLFFEDLPEKFTAKRKQTNNLQYSSLKKQASTKSLVSNVFNRKGIEGLGYVLLAQSPKILAAQTEKPSFPAFLTISFIQNTVEEDIIPRLNDILSACKRLEKNNMSLALTVFDEAFELDNGDILLFEAGIRLLRAGLGLFTTYNMDLRCSDGSSIMKLYDEYNDMDELKRKYTYRLDNDTLVCLGVFNAEQYTSKIADAVQYNLKNTDFLKIRRANHEWVYNDLKMVPELIKSSLKSMKEETDGQEDDLIAAGEIFDINSDMADISTEMYENGFSPSLSGRFASPEALMDFVTELLTKEYTFNESIDGYNIIMTINLSKWFTSPVSDLKTLFPKYRLPQNKDRIISFIDKGYDRWGSGNSFYADPEDIIDIPSSLIANIDDEWDYKIVTLTKNISVCMWVDSTVFCTPIILTDDAGKDIPFQMMEDIFYDIEVLRECFPYFNDYTVNGLFPKMTTRNSWIDFIGQFYDR